MWKFYWTGGVRLGAQKQNMGRPTTNKVYMCMIVYIWCTHYITSKGSKREQSHIYLHTQGMNEMHTAMVMMTNDNRSSTPSHPIPMRIIIHPYIHTYIHTYIQWLLAAQTWHAIHAYRSYQTGVWRLQFLCLHKGGYIRAVSITWMVQQKNKNQSWDLKEQKIHPSYRISSLTHSNKQCLQIDST